MKKRVLVVVIVVVLMLAVSATSFAVASPTDPQIPSMPGAIVKAEPATPEQITVAGDAATKAGVVVTGAPIGAFDVKVLDANGQPITKFDKSTQVVLQVPGVTVGEWLVLVHTDSEGKSQVYGPFQATVAGQVSFFTMSLSPVVVYRAPAPAAAKDTAAVETAKSTKTSPKTGQGEEMMILMVLAILAATGVVFTAKKVKSMS